MDDEAVGDGRDNRTDILARLARVVSVRDPDAPLALRLCWACTDILDVDGASITVAADGDRVTHASSDATAERLDHLHDVLGEVALTDALTSGDLVAAKVGDDVQERWPMFVPAASEALGPLPLATVPNRARDGRTLTSAATAVVEAARGAPNVNRR